MIKARAGKKEKLPAVFVQYGVYANRNDRRETHFEVIYGINRDQIEKAIQKAINEVIKASLIEND